MEPSRMPQIRPAVPGVEEALTDLHLDVWDEAYHGLVPDELLRERRSTRADRVARWRDNLRRADASTLVAWDDRGRPHGFVSAGPGRDEPREGLPGREVWALYVRAEDYGQGLGHALLTAAIGSVSAYLWVLSGNRRAIGFYERQGFGFDGAVKEGPAGEERRMTR